MDLSAASNHGVILKNNDTKISNTVEDQADEKSKPHETPPVMDKFKIHITDPEFRKYLEKQGAIIAIKESVTALYHADPKPKFPKLFLRNHFACLCNIPPDPLVELIEARYKVKHLEEENEALREKLIVSIQRKAKKKTEKPRSS